jgi:hypothetical protein
MINFFRHYPRKHTGSTEIIKNILHNTNPIEILMETPR